MSNLKKDIDSILEGINRMMELDKCDYGICMDAQNAFLECLNRLEALENIVSQTLWMARRYADNRSTYAPSIVNECIDKALELEIDMSGPPEEIYARDGMFGSWNPQTKCFEK